MKNENMNLDDLAELSEQEMSNISGGTADGQGLTEALKTGTEQMKFGLVKPSGGSQTRLG